MQGRKSKKGTIKGQLDDLTTWQYLRCVHRGHLWTVYQSSSGRILGSEDAGGSFISNIFPAPKDDLDIWWHLNTLSCAASVSAEGIQHVSTELFISLTKVQKLIVNSISDNFFFRSSQVWFSHCWSTCSLPVDAGPSSGPRCRKKQPFFDLPDADDADGQKHREWAERLWHRMDRGPQWNGHSRGNLCVMRFQEILKAVIAPKRTKTNAAYSRAEINVTQAVDFLYAEKLHRTEVASSRLMNLAPFLRVLRKTGASSRKADLIFALFDLDQSGFLDKEEFLEVYRYFLGHRPTAEKFEEEWANVDVAATGRVSQKQYDRWLRASNNSVFKPYATTDDAVEAGPKFSKKDANGLLQSTRQKEKCLAASLEWPLELPRQLHPKQGSNAKTETYVSPGYNQNQSFRRFYMRHPRWDSHYVRLDAAQQPRPQSLLTPDFASAPTWPACAKWKDAQSGHWSTWDLEWVLANSEEFWLSFQSFTPGFAPVALPWPAPWTSSARQRRLTSGLKALSLLRCEICVRYEICVNVSPSALLNRTSVNLWQRLQSMTALPLQLSSWHAFRSQLPVQPRIGSLREETAHAHLDSRWVRKPGTHMA